MEQFDINRVIEHYKLNTDSLAKALFPHVKYPKQAFDRILKGEADLDVKQLLTLASYTGVTIYDLFSVGMWKTSIEDNCLILIKGEYKVKLNYNNVFMTVYKNDKPIKSLIGFASSMTIDEFIELIDNLIKDYENGNS